MKILFVEADTAAELSTSTHLMRVPAAAISRTGVHQARVIHRDQFLKEPVDLWPDLCVFERLLLAPFTEKIKEYKSAGISTLVRFDDAYHLLPSYISSAALWRKSLVGVPQPNGSLAAAKMDISAMKQFREGLGVCDAASTPSRLLCQDYERFAKKMFYLPNYVDLGNPAWTEPKPKHEGIIIGWGSGGTHKQSVRDSSLLPALSIICRKYPEVKIMICGHEEWVKKQVANRVSEDQLITQGWVPNEEWPRTVAKFDIGLAPLAGAYDDRRSSVKVQDYAILGIPFVCSDRPPYRDVQGGIRVTNKTKNWVRAIRSIIERESTRERLSSFGLRWGRTRGISQNISKYLNMMTEVLKE